jgi:predicted nucleic acid-binding protein
LIVFDASTMVSAALKVDGVPERALLRAYEVALSVAVEAEMSAVLSSEAVWFDPLVRVTDCRDLKDDMYLELALAAGAETIVSSDG